MPKLKELSDKQLSYQIKKYTNFMDDGTESDLDRKKLKALVSEKKKRKPKQPLTNKKLNNTKIFQTKKRKLGKIRNPWVVMLLMVVTLGIYGLIYIYKTASEIHHYRKTGINGIMMLIISIIPMGGLITIFLFPKYIKKLHHENGKECSLTWHYGFLAFIPFGAIALIYIQQKRLNEFWENASKMSLP